MYVYFCLNNFSMESDSYLSLIRIFTKMILETNFAGAGAADKNINCLTLWLPMQNLFIVFVVVVRKELTCLVCCGCYTCQCHLLLFTKSSGAVEHQKKNTNTRSKEKSYLSRQIKCERNFFYSKN